MAFEDVVRLLIIAQFHENNLTLILFRTIADILP